GVPSLLREGFTRIRERFRVAPIFTRALYFTLGGGALAEHLDATVARFPSVGIGSYPRFDDADHRVKVTFDGRDVGEVRSAASFLRERGPAAPAPPATPAAPASRPARNPPAAASTNQSPTAPPAAPARPPTHPAAPASDSRSRACRAGCAPARARRETAAAAASTAWAPP